LNKLVEIYSEMIDQIESADGIQEKLVTQFPMKGRHYNGKIMVVGRAVNGWEDSEWEHGELSDSTKKERYLSKLIALDEGKCPMDWVKMSWGNTGPGYNSKKSAFWRVIHNIMNQLGYEEDWSNNFIWSNLYKIAPADGGNPSAKLIKLQKEKCVQLLREEFLLWKPKIILFLTGMNWAGNFIKDITEIEINSVTEGLVEGTGVIRINNQIGKVIIAKHPQGKNESEMVNEIMSALD
jgi:hypothetical protein